MVIGGKMRPGPPLLTLRLRHPWRLWCRPFWLKKKPTPPRLLKRWQPWLRRHPPTLTRQPGWDADCFDTVPTLMPRQP